MLLKTIILILLIGLIISLASGLVFLFRDVGTTKRTLHSLGVRVTLAVALVATIVYGFFSGQLEIGAPWDGRKFHNNQTATSPAITQPLQNAPAPATGGDDPGPGE